MSKPKRKSKKLEKVETYELTMLAIKPNRKKKTESRDEGKLRVEVEPTGDVIVFNEDGNRPLACRPLKHGQPALKKESLTTIHPYGERRFPAADRAFAWVGYKFLTGNG